MGQPPWDLKAEQFWPAKSLRVRTGTERLQTEVERLVGPLHERRSGKNRRQTPRIPRGRRESDYLAEAQGDRA
jgi:hypothetical protein